MVSRAGRGFAITALLAVAMSGCGHPHGTGLVGTWKGSLSDPKSGASVDITTTFNPDGTRTETVTGSGMDATMTFTYTVQNGVMKEHFLSGTVNGRAKQVDGLETTSTYTLDGDTFTESQPGKATITFHRA